MTSEPRVRDAGLGRIRTLTRWLVAGGVLASGALSVFVARSQPGHTARRVTTVRGAAPQPAPESPAFDDGGGTPDAGLAPPANDPAPSRDGGGMVVSGGS